MPSGGEVPAQTTEFFFSDSERNQWWSLGRKCKPSSVTLDYPGVRFPWARGDLELRPCAADQYLDRSDWEYEHGAIASIG